MVGSTLIRAGQLAPLLILFAMSICKGQVQDTSGLIQLRERVLNEIKQYPLGQFGIAFKDLQSEATIFINENSAFHAASTMKTPVMAEVFAQATAGKFNLEDEVLVYNNFTSIADGSKYSVDVADDSEQELYQQIGSGITISELIYGMITKSSNLATNILIDKVGASAVNRAMRNMGAQHISILRGVEDQKAFDKGMNNMVTAKDLMLLFEKLASEKLVSSEASKQMVAILKQQHLKGAIPAKLPSGVHVANKTGSITRVLNDSGIVFLPNGRKYVLVLLSSGLELEPAMAVLSNISLYFYEHMVPR